MLLLCGGLYLTVRLERANYKNRQVNNMCAQVVNHPNDFRKLVHCKTRRWTKGMVELEDNHIIFFKLLSWTIIPVTTAAVTKKECNLPARTGSKVIPLFVLSLSLISLYVEVFLHNNYYQLARKLWLHYNEWYW